MPVQVRYATESLVSTLASLNITSFAGQGFITNTFSNVADDAIFELKCKRYLQKLAHPKTHVLVAIDEDTGEVAGCARWIIPGQEAGNQLSSDEAAAEAGAELVLPEGTNRGIYDGFFEVLKEKGEKYYREDDIVLEFLATHPDHQGRGVGKALLRWGMDRADKQQRRIYVEATTPGFPLYARMGWTALDEVAIDYARWGGEGKQILPLTKSDIPQAVECIQTVFADDPFFLYMFDQDTYNPARNAASLSAHFLHGLSINAPIYVAKTTTNPQSRNPESSSRILGICWWHPPTPTTSPTPLNTRIQDSLLSIRQLLANIRYAGRGGLHLHRYRQWKTLQSRTHAQIWDDERGYYFCNVIAVRSEMRGCGLGRRLVEAVTRRADEEGMPCYLESSKGMPNLAIYERLGFEGVTEIDCVDGKDICTLYCMTRPPVTNNAKRY
ncbi:acyl-CoA N-acyltransferase [Aspergillus carlsbadensis]|nr:acyl-CoA N-acyltransferase [Aspergillus carlsbadensis]